MMQRRNFIAVALGKKGSGKSYLLNRYSQQFPRRLTFDATGERLEQYPNAIHAFGVEQVLNALESVAQYPRWQIIAVIDPDDAAGILRVVAPLSPVVPGYARSVGGVCVEMPELDQIAPNSAAIAREVRNIFQRGRHHAVSILGDSQRPHLVNRLCTGMADVIIAFQQHEPRDLKWLADAMSVPLAQYVARLGAFGQYVHMRYFTATGVADIVDKSGGVLLRLRSDGARLATEGMQ